MITRALLEFIQREQSSGVTRGDITLALEGKGWKGDDVTGAFALLAEGDDRTVPTPPASRILAETCEILSLIWSVYRSRWKRFVGVGVLYCVALLFLEMALYMWVLPIFPAFLRFITSGDITSAFFFAAPYLAIGTFGYILLQLWYIGTLYAVSLKKGDSLTERARTGLLHLPAVLGIKVSMALLMMIVFVPVLATTFLTDNILVFIVFGPFALLGALFLQFLFSFALPAYFHGTPWHAAVHRSIKIVSQNVLPLFALYLCFGVLVCLFFLFIRETPLVTAAVLFGIVTPMQVLLQIALYRRFAPPAPAPTVSPSMESEKKPEKKVRKATKALAA